jgi:hypothetical protein
MSDRHRNRDRYRYRIPNPDCDTDADTDPDSFQALGCSPAHDETAAKSSLREQLPPSGRLAEFPEESQVGSLHGCDQYRPIKVLVPAFARSLG